MNPYQSQCMGCMNRPTCGGSGMGCPGTNVMGSTCMGSCGKTMGSVRTGSVGIMGVMGVGLGMGFAALAGYINGWVGARLYGPKGQRAMVAKTTAKGAATIAGVLGGVALLGTALFVGSRQRQPDRIAVDVS